MAAPGQAADFMAAFVTRDRPAVTFLPVTPVGLAASLHEGCLERCLAVDALLRQGADLMAADAAFDQ